MHHGPPRPPAQQTPSVRHHVALASRGPAPRTPAARCCLQQAHSSYGSPWRHQTYVQGPPAALLRWPVGRAVAGLYGPAEQLPRQRQRRGRRQHAGARTRPTPAPARRVLPYAAPPAPETQRSPRDSRARDSRASRASPHPPAAPVLLWWSRPETRGTGTWRTCSARRWPRC